MEKPYSFTMDDVRYFLYPPTLGKTFLLQRVMDATAPDLELMRLNPYAEAIRLSETKKELAARYLALHTLRNKEELMDNTTVERRTALFAEGIGTEDMATLFVIATTSADIEAYKKQTGMDKEAEWLRKAGKAKKSSGTLTFGGKSIYGTLIDRACERYGWTMEYVVWGISYVNLRMLMDDAAVSIYLTKEEMKRAHIPEDRTFISADDPSNREKIKSMLNN